MDNGADALQVFVVSGGTGGSGDQLLNAVLAQFPEAAVRLNKVAAVREREEIAAVVSRAAAAGGLIVHTLVDPELRDELTRSAAEQSVAAVDLMGDLMARLAAFTGQEPLVEPGLYRRLHRDYFARIEAIDFAIQHDDGQNHRGLRRAEVVLLGVSRAGKTPLSMYLAMQGWLVANVAVVPGVPPPEELDEVDPRRIVGLLIDHEQLIEHRKQRHDETGMTTATAYVDETRVFRETENYRNMLRQNRFATIDVTNKPIESTAGEIVALLQQRLGDDARRT